MYGRRGQSKVFRCIYIYLPALFPLLGSSIRNPHKTTKSAIPIVSSDRQAITETQIFLPPDRIIPIIAN